MLTWTWRDLLVEEQRRKDMIARTEERRQGLMLVKVAKAKENVFEGWMIALGERLVSWGCQLQARYQRTVQASTGDSAAMSITLDRTAAAGTC